LKLSPRMVTILKNVPKQLKVADIGTDHGFIPIYLALQNLSNYIVASDVKQGSLNKAIKEVKKYNLEKMIDLRLGSGLSVLKKGEVDVAIIAGMGGILISEILQKDEEIAKTINKFILQPMKSSNFLRKFLYKNGYKIINEDLVKEKNKFYEIIIAEHGCQKCKDEIYCEVGEPLIKNNHILLNEFIQYKIDKLKNIIINMPSERRTERYNELVLKLERYEVLLNELKMSDNSFNDG